VPKIVLLILKRGSFPSLFHFLSLHPYFFFFHRDWPASTVGRLNKFLQLSIRFALEHLHLDLRLMLLTLSRIFNTTSQQYIFYEYCGKGDDLDEVERVAKRRLFLSLILVFRVCIICLI